MLQLNDIKQPMISLKTQNNNHNETIKNVSKQFQQTLPKNYLEPLFYRITKKKASRIVRHAYISYFIRKKNKELQSITKIAFIFFPIFTHLHIFLPDWHKIIESKENAIEKFCFFHHWRNNKKKESEKKIYLIFLHFCWAGAAQKKYFPKMIFYEFWSRLCLLNQYFCISDNISYTRDDEGEPRRNSKVMCHPSYLSIHTCLFMDTK